MSTAEMAALTWPVDEDQVDLLRRGSEDALAELYSLYRDRLGRMVKFRMDPRLLGRIDPADVLQEAYIEIAQRVDDFLAEPVVSPYVWMRQITWQTLLTVHRRHLGQKRNPNHEIPLHAVAHGRSSACSVARQLAGRLTSPSQAAMREERTLFLRQTIEQMEETDREILVLRHFEQLGNTEVAEILGIRKTAASNRYVRALKRLRECLRSTPADAEF